MTAVLVAFPVWAWAALVPLGLFAAFCLLLFVVALVEKIPVRQFEEEPIPPDEAPDLTPYMYAMNDAAAQRGFTYTGTYQHAKYASLFVSYWLSPDGRTMARIASGKIAKMNSKSTALVSELANGRWIITRDELTTELSSLIDMHVQVNADFDELWALHWSRVQPYLAGVRTLAGPKSLRDIDQEWERRRAEALVARGIARWTDMSKSVFRYTLAGATRIVV